MAGVGKQAMKVVVMMGSTRDGRNGERVARLVSKKLLDAGHNATIAELFADPLKLALPLLRNPIHFLPDPSKANPDLQELSEMVKGADAYVLVTPEYNRNMPPALLNLLNHCPPSSYAFKTSAIVSYSMGPGGGSSVQAQARQFMVEMGAPPIPFMFTIGQVHEAISPDGDVLNTAVEEKAKTFMKQFEWFAEALNNQRAAKPPPYGKGTMVSG